MNNTDKSVIAIIMAGGLGKRMESDIPKVLHKINNIPMINSVLLKLILLSGFVNLEKIVIVVGKYKNEIKKAIEEQIDLAIIVPKMIYVVQEEALGTGHAIYCCINELKNYMESDVLILSGDVPMLTSFTMINLLDLKSKAKIITTTLDNPYGYGRILLTDNIFDRIIEQKECTNEELNIRRINGGIYAIQSKILHKYLPYIKNDNAQKEYYLTDIIEIIKNEEKIEIDMLEIDKKNAIEIIGVNTIRQLKELEMLINKKNCLKKN